MTVGASGSVDCSGGATFHIACTAGCSVNCGGGSTCDLKCATDAAPKTIGASGGCGERSMFRIESRPQPRA
jgi:hypothetical protein